MTEPCLCGALDCSLCHPFPGSDEDEPSGWDPYEPEDEDE